MGNSTAILSVRVSEQEKATLAYAAEQSKSTISEFVRRSALIAAELALMERRVIEIPAERWEEFEAQMNAPAKRIPELVELANSKPLWDE